MRKKVWLIGPKLWNPSVQGLSQADQHIFIDGGLIHREKIPEPLKRDVPSFALGDGDSLREHGVNVEDKFDLIFPEDKDQSDFSLALSHLPDSLKAGSIDFYLYGLSGGRKDHELALIGECFHFLKGRSDCAFHLHFPDNKREATIIGRQADFSYHGIFSVFSFEKAEVTIFGEVKFPIEKEALLPFQSLGLSNEAKGAIKINSDKPLIIYWGEERG